MKLWKAIVKRFIPQNHEVRKYIGKTKRILCGTGNKTYDLFVMYTKRFIWSKQHNKESNALFATDLLTNFENYAKVLDQTNIMYNFSFLNVLTQE